MNRSDFYIKLAAIDWLGMGNSFTGECVTPWVFYDLRRHFKPQDIKNALEVLDECPAKAAAMTNGTSGEHRAMLLLLMSAIAKSRGE